MANYVRRGCNATRASRPETTRAGWLVVTCALTAGIALPGCPSAPETSSSDALVRRHSQSPPGGGIENPPPPPAPQPVPVTYAPLPSDPVGYLPGSGSVDMMSGESTYTIPLDTPASRGDVEPHLSLAYGSRSGSGLLGVGWSLSGLSEIRRCAKTIASDGVTDGIGYSSLDDFCIDGKRLQAVHATLQAIEYRTELDSFAKIELNLPGSDQSGTFRVYEKNGLVEDYVGLSEAMVTITTPPETGVSASSGSGSFNTPVTGVWVLKTVTDRSGNTATYDYDVESTGEYTLRTIQYAGSTVTGDSPQREVDFHYATRPDPSFAWEAGVKTPMTKRLSSVDMRAPDPNSGKTEIVWTYDFDYAVSAITRRSLLASVHQCDAQNVCKWGKTFSWTDSTSGFTPTDLPSDGTNFALYSSDTLAYPAGTQEILVFDADGDGIQDILYEEPGEFPSYVLRTSNGPGAPLANAWGVGNAIGSGVNQPFVPVAAIRAIDVDGDGKFELYVPKYAVVDHCYSYGYQLFRWNTGTHTLDAVGPLNVMLTAASGGGAGPGCDVFGFYPGTTLPDAAWVDLDGDGLPDRVDGAGGTSGATQSYFAHMNAGGGQFGPPIALLDIGYSALSPGGLLAVDVQGDGRGDVIQAGASGLGGMGIFPGGGPQALALAGLELGVPLEDSPSFSSFADLNGDGVEDVVYAKNSLVGSVNGSTAVAWNVGGGFMAPQPIDIPLVGTVVPAKDTDSLTPTAGANFKVGDLNDDGRDDLVNPRGGQVFLSNGDGTFQTVDIGVDVADYSVAVGDVTGDGVPELIGVVNNTIRYTQVPWRDNHDLLAAVSDENAQFPRDQFVYSRKWENYYPDQAARTCTFPQYCVRSGFPVVTSYATTMAETSDGQDRSYQIDYSYEDPRTDLHGRGSLGFAKAHALDRQLNSETTISYDNRTSETFTNQYTGTKVSMYPFLGMPLQETHVAPIVSTPAAELWSGATQKLTTRARVTIVNHEYAWNHESPGSYWAHPTKETSQEWERQATLDYTHITLPAHDATADLLRTRTIRHAFDGYGNETSTKSSTQGGIASTVTNTYSNDATHWLIGLLTDSQWSTSAGYTGTCPTAGGGPITVVGNPGLGLGDFVRETAYTYDPQGRVATETHEPNAVDPSVTATATYTRGDPRGLVTRITTTVAGVAPRGVTIGYDAEGAYPRTFTNDLQHTITEYHHPAFGTLWLALDANGVASGAQYDGFGRMKSVLPADNDNVSITYSPYTPNANDVQGITTSTASLDGSKKRVSTDALGRTVVESVLGFDGAWDVSRTTFDNAGQTFRSYRPGVGHASSAYSQWSYDTLGRPTSLVAPDGATTSFENTFSKTTITDPAGHVRWSSRDVDERTIESGNVTGSHSLETKFCYGEFSLVDATTDPGGGMTATIYDVLGRPLQRTNPDSGKVLYSYDGFGEIVQRVDALGTTHYGYDAIGRRTSQTDSDGDTSWTWDTAPGCGASGTCVEKLATTTSPDGTTTSFAYDTIGRWVDKTWSVEGAPYSVDAAYDDVGQLQAISYPAVPGRPRFVVQNIYNAAGYLYLVQDGSAGTNAARTLWTAKSRNADLALTDSQFGNGVESQLSYDSSTGRLTGIVEGNNALSLSYQYYPNGEVQSRIDPGTGHGMGFTYDDLDRLTGWTIGTLLSADGTAPVLIQQMATSYQYDDMGNIVTVKVNGAVTETAKYGTPQSAHAVAWDSVQGTFGYDGRGRQVSGMGRTTAFTNFDLPRSVTTDSGKTTFDYDADGRRVFKSGPDGATVSLAGLFERRQAAGTGPAQDVFYVKGADATVAEVVFDESTESQRTLYFGTDSLGSVQVVLDESGSVVETRYFDPWGKAIDAQGGNASPVANDPVALGFTGQRSDDDLGTVDMNGRIYDPLQRRFITPDTVVPNPNYGQAYNGWIYVYDNPLGYTDPSGHNPCDDKTLVAIDCPPPGGEGGGANPGETVAKAPRARSRPGHAAGNNPPPAASDASTPGGNDPREVPDTVVSHEGVNGEYSSPEAWDAEHVGERLDKFEKAFELDVDRVLHAVENAVVNTVYDFKLLGVRLQPGLYDHKGEDMAAYVADVEQTRASHLTIPDQETADLTRHYSALTPFVMAFAGGKGGGAAFAEGRNLPMPWTFGRAVSTMAEYTFRVGAGMLDRGDALRIVRPLGYQQGAKFSRMGLDYYAVVEQGGWLVDPMTGTKAASLNEMLEKIGIDVKEVDLMHLARPPEGDFYQAPKAVMPTMRIGDNPNDYYQ